jgi:uncharacterized protein (DUF433 family)
VVAAVANNIFVEGIYTVEQAAHLARLSTRALRRWLDGEGDKAPALVRRMPKNDAEVLGFVDLIQAMAIRAIRNTGKLSLQKVRQTIIESEKLGIRYPFARRHQTYLFADDVVIRLDDDRLIQVTGKYRQQQLIKPVVELYLDDLTFNPDSGLADEYTPLRDSGNGRKIVINPAVKYGAPVVIPCGYTVNSLVTAVDSEGSIQAAADIYDVPEADVKFALRYEDILAGTAE